MAALAPIIEETLATLSIYSIYPNPASKKITITGNRNFTGETMIDVFNMKGEEVKVEKFQNQSLIQMDVSNLPKGIYLMRIQSMEGIESKKFVIR